MPLHVMLLQQQLLYYGRIKSNEKHPAHELIKTKILDRRRGRPRLNWMDEMTKHAEQIQKGSECEGIDLFINPHWHSSVKAYTGSMV